MSGMTKSGLAWRGIVMVGLLGTVACGPGFAPVGVEVAVQRPPRERVEVRGVAPGAGYVWIQGHYAWQGGTYTWISGRWEAPPQPTYRRWEPGHWVHARSGWYWVEGHWR